MPVAFEILKGLPGEGPPPEQFTTRGGTHAEGIVVRIAPGRGEPWVGNFQPGQGSFSGVFPHPDGRHVAVVAGRDAFVVHAETRRLVHADGRSDVDAVFTTGGRLVLASCLDLVVVDPGGAVWRSPIVSCDGFGDVRIDGHRLTALGADEMGGRGRRIEIDLSTRDVLASACPAAGRR